VAHRQLHQKFNGSDGIHGTGISIASTSRCHRSFVERLCPAHYLQAIGFQRIIPGSGSGNSGLTTALNYLTPGANSPIDALNARRT